MPGPVTLKRGRSQATLVSLESGPLEVSWRVPGRPDGLGMLSRDVPLQVALNVDEPAEFFYRKFGSSGAWLPVQSDGAQ
jgi:hypothetical protein